MATTKNGETVRGTVCVVFKSTAKWSAGKLRTKEGVFGFTAPGPVRDGSGLVLSGEWTQDPKWGRQFKAKSYTEDVGALDNRGLAGWLSSRAEFGGIGPVRAKKIAEAFGDKFEETLETELGRQAMARVARCDLEIIEAMRDAWREDQASNRACSDLMALGLTAIQARKVFRAFKADAVTKVRACPWVLVGLVEGFGFKTVDAFARSLGTRKDDPLRARAALLYILEKTEEMGGHTWIAATDLQASAMRELALETLDADVVVRKAIETGVAKGDFVEFRGPGGTYYSHPDLHRAEKRWLAFVERSADAAVEDLAPSEEELRAEFSSLNDDQVRAVRVALSSRLAVITGGAGVGKTYIVRVISEILKRRGRGEILCAPTGKAARRLAESVGVGAETIHRTLEPRSVTTQDGEMSFGFARGAENPLDADVVFVDEVSMVDVRLMASLIAALPKRSRLILVGDHHQLPPVGAGSILRDLVTQRPCPVVELRQVVRQAGALKVSVNAVLEGKILPTEPAAPHADGSLRPWVLVGNLEDPQAAADFVVASWSDYLPRYTIEDLKTGVLRPVNMLSDVQVLTPTHKGPLGTIALNRRIQRVVQRGRGVELPADDSPDVAGDENEETKIRESRPLVGDKVMWKKNHRELNIQNGTLGIVLEDNRDGSMVVHFEGDLEPKTIPTAERGLLTLAYAITVHKSQGSEWPVAVCVLHRTHSFQLHRGLAYTAVSRSRRSAIIVGDANGPRRAAAKVATDSRRTLAMLFGRHVFEGIPAAQPWLEPMPFQSAPAPAPAITEEQAKEAARRALPGIIGDDEPPPRYDLDDSEGMSLTN